MVTAALETAADMHLPSEEAARTCQPKVCSLVEKLHRDRKAWLGIAMDRYRDDYKRTRANKKRDMHFVGVINPA